MFLLSWPRQGEKKHLEKKLQRPVCNGVLVIVDKIQRMFANFLQKEVERLPARVRNSLFLLIFLILTSISASLLVRSLVSGKNIFFSIVPITIPRYTNKNGLENTRAAFVLSRVDYERVRIFKWYLDSLV